MANSSATTVLAFAPYWVFLLLSAPLFGQEDCTIPPETRSLIPNPYFENYDPDRGGCFSQQDNGLPDGDKQANCLVGWRQASFGTTDAWNLLTANAAPPIYPSAIPTPIPSGAGVVGFFVGVSDVNDLRELDGSPPNQYREYISACFNNGERLVAGQDYRLDFNLGFTPAETRGDSIIRSAPTVELAVYGIRNCEQIFFSSYECPEDAGADRWELISTIDVSGTANSWTSVSLEFTATTNYQALAIGGSCAADDIPPGFGFWRNYYFLDDVILNVTDLFQPPVIGPIQVAWDGSCDDDILLSVPAEGASGGLQWFRDGLAVPGATGRSLVLSATDDYEGLYTLEVTTAGGCSVTDPVRIQRPVVPDIFPELVFLCPDEVGNYFIEAKAIGNYSYLWDDGSTEEFREIRRSGVYSVTVTGACGEAVETIETTLDGPQPDLNVVPFRACPGQEVSVELTSNYNIFITEFEIGDQVIAAGNLRGFTFVMPTDEIRVRVNYADDCGEYNVGATVRLNEQFAVTETIRNPNCAENTGRIDLALDSPEEVTFAWTNAAGNPVGTNAPFLETTLTGVYNVTLSGDNDRCPTTLAYEIFFDDDFQAMVTTDPVRCAADAAATVSPSDGEAPYVAAWFRADSTPISATGLSVSDLDIGTYFVNVTDARGCVISSSFNISGPDTLSVGATSRFGDCGADNSGIVTALPAGGTPPYRYQLNGGAATDSPEFTGLGGGDYELTVTDANGCTAQSATFGITLPTPYAIEAGENRTIVLGDSTRINLQVSDPELELVSISWEPAEGLSCVNCASPVASPPRTTTYSVTTESIEGCVETDELLVLVDNVARIYAPNAFSPNGDGTNDSWQLFPGPGVDRILGVSIYDRWGELVFESAEENPRWNGELADRPMNPAVFVYVALVRMRDGREELLRGDLVLVR